MSYIRMVDGVEIPMTPEEIEQRQAEESTPVQLPLYDRVKMAFGLLDIALQAKYKDEIRDGAFFLKEENLPMLGVIVAQAESKYSLPEDQAVKNIVDAVKAELEVLL